jgi:uncharacterized membrane protein
VTDAQASSEAIEQRLNESTFWGVRYGSWLLLLVVLSAAAQLVLSALYYLELNTQSGDLGIFLQAFWSTGHGWVFWETPDFASKGVPSLLSVHFSWVLFLLFPVFYFAPSAFTLFAAQAVALALAAVPLYRLTSLVTGSYGKALLAAGLYLAWAPLYAGNPDSFHLESFLPVQLFVVFLLWLRGRYDAGIAVATLAAFTIDGAGIFTFLTGLFFLSFRLQVALREAGLDPVENIRSLWPEYLHRAGPVPVRRRTSLLSASRAAASAALRDRAVWGCLALMGVSAGVFFAMRFLESSFLSWIGVAGQSLSITRVVGFSFANIAYATGQKTIFWFLMLATVGFLPLLYPRTWILLVPWIGYTFCEAQPSWYSITFHYVSVAAFPLFIGVAYGLRRFRVPQDSARPAVNQTAGPTPVTPFSTQGVPFLAEGIRRRRRRVSRAYVALLVLIAVNVMLTPFNPLMDSVVAPGYPAEFLGRPYSVLPFDGTGWNSVLGLTSLIPQNATILTQIQFFPLLNTHPWAYPTTLTSHQYLPFNSTILPEYLLGAGTSGPQFNHYIPDLSRMMWNQSDYGVRAWVQTTNVGSVFLWQRGYSGPAQTFGPIVYSRVDYRIGSSILNGVAGQVSSVPHNGSDLTVVESLPNSSGLVWSSLHSGALPPGTYVVILTSELVASANCSGIPPDAAAIGLAGGIPGYSPPLVRIVIDARQLSCGQFTAIAVPFTIDHPVPGWFLDGYQPNPGQSFALASLSLVPRQP